MNPLVTVITPSYNQAAFLEYAIQSVLQQDYSPVEYFVIDGGSTDGSVDIIKRHSRQLAGWVSEPDSGQAEAINKGFQQASGDIIAWLNSDDFYLPGAIRQAVSLLEQNPGVGMVFGNALTVDTKGRPIKQLVFGSWGLEQLIRFRIVCQPAVFFRRSVLEKAGYLDPSYHFMLDHHLWVRLARIAPVRYACYQLDGNQAEMLPWAAARHHPGAKNVSQSQGFSLETLRLLDWMHTQPDLLELIRHDHRNVIAGAYRLNARYLLDGGRYGDALKSYANSLLASPVFALKHWHRMLYAALAWVGLKNVLDKLRMPFQMKSQKDLILSLQSRQPDQDGILKNWPGLSLQVDR